MKKHLFLIPLFFLIALNTACADELSALSVGQTVYVPAYSHIYIGNREKPFLLTVTLHVRNVDPKNSITVRSVDYYDSNGNLLKKYLPKPLTLRPLSSSRHVVPRNEKQGGAGAGFLVSWSAEKAVNPPIMETVMIGAESQQGISFTSRGQVIAVEQ
jgi:hypothetical protein